MGSRTSLWHHADFRRLWIGDTAAQAGVALGMLAVPYFAVTALHASDFQMGLLSALGSVGFLLVALPAGALVDRHDKRTIMIGADLGRALLLLTLPVAFWLGMLTLAQLMVVAALVGVLTVFFDVSYQSYLPTLVRRDQVVEGNAKLQASQSVSQGAGPAIGGFLLTRLGPAPVIVVNAAGYLLSAAWLWRIKHRDVPVVPTGPRRMRTEIAEGLSFIVRHPLLRRLIACTALGNLTGSAMGALLVLYQVRTLGMSAWQIGLVDSVAAVGGLLGALITTRMARTIGEGPTVIVTATAMMLLAFHSPLASVLPPIPTFMVGGSAMMAMIVAYNVATVSFRQRLCPPALLGRMNASARFLVWGTMPIGALLGGTLATTLGVTRTLWLMAGLGLLALIPVLTPTLWRLHTLPDHADLQPPVPLEVVDPIPGGNPPQGDPRR